MHMPWQEGANPLYERDNRAEKLRHFSTICSEMTPQIYLGGDVVAQNLEQLQSHGITHVRCTAAAALCIRACSPVHQSLQPVHQSLQPCASEPVHPSPICAPSAALCVQPARPYASQVLNAAGVACPNYHEGALTYLTLHLYDSASEVSCSRHAHAMRTPCTRRAHAVLTPCTRRAPLRICE